jgi:hypothetical protein
MLSSISRNQKIGLFLLAIVSTFILLVWAPAEILFSNYCFNNYDLGIYAQAIHRLSLSDPNPWLSVRNIHLFNDHFDPILFLVTPFKGLTSPPLLAIRTEMLIALAGIIPLAVLAYRKTLSLVGFVFSACFLLFSPVVVDAYFYPVHPGTWAILPLVCTLALLNSERWRTAALFFVLALLCKEEFPFVGFAVAAALWIQRKRPAAFAFAALSLVWAVFTFVIRPRLIGPSPQYTGAVSGIAGVSVLTNPREFFSVAQRLLWLFLPLLPLTFVAWKENRKLRTFLLPMLPALAALGTLFAVRAVGGWWFSHRSAPLAAAALFCVVPFLNSDFKASKRTWMLTFFLLFAVALAPIQQGFRAYTGRPYQPYCPDNFDRKQALGAAREVFRTLPSGPALIQGNLLPFMLERPDVTHLGASIVNDSDADFLFVETPPGGDAWPLRSSELEARVRAWRADPNVIPIIDNSYAIILQRRRNP